MKKSILAVAILAVALTACGGGEEIARIDPNGQQPVVGQSQQVRQVKQGSDGFDTGDMLLAGVAGYMLGGTGSTRPPPQVVHQTVINKTIIRQAPPATKPAAKYAPATKPAAKYVPAKPSFSNSYRPSASRKR